MTILKFYTAPCLKARKDEGTGDYVIAKTASNDLS